MSQQDRCEANASGRLAYAIVQEADVENAMCGCRRCARQLGFSESVVFMVATALVELARNMLYHAGGGTMTINECSRASRWGIELVAIDHGPGISDVALAMQDHFSTRGTLGIGLPAVKRMMDSMDIETVVGQGTTVRACKWL